MIIDNKRLIMSLIVKGATIDQIASQIHMSKRSVDNYIRKIYGKLGAASKIAAVQKFILSSQYSQ
jgi:two-component system, NarL family, competent response regulator ComA